VLDAADFDTPSTKQAAQALETWGGLAPLLVVITTEQVGALKSFRNIERVSVTEVGSIGVADVIGAASIVISKEALERLGEVLG
jgi:large subunit ribosomal protein L4